MTEEEKILRRAQGYTIYEYKGKTICLNLENFDKEKFCKDWGFNEVEIFKDPFSDAKVLYDPTQYEILNHWEDYLHYTGASNKPIQPFGCKTLDRLFEFRLDFEEIDLSHWYMSNCFSLCSLFYGCENLKAINISNWDVSKCRVFDEMFAECSNLCDINLSNWNVGNGEEFSRMFKGCESLKSLDVSKWSVSSGHDFYYMFDGCTNISDLDLSSWVINEKADCRYMFNNCEKLFEKYQVKDSDELMKKLLQITVQSDFRMDCF